MVASGRRTRGMKRWGRCLRQAAVVEDREEQQGGRRSFRWLDPPGKGGGRPMDVIEVARCGRWSPMYHTRQSDRKRTPRDATKSREQQQAWNQQRRKDAD